MPLILPPLALCLATQAKCLREVALLSANNGQLVKPNTPTPASPTGLRHPVLGFLKRRGGDSNPRYRLRGTTVFETAAFSPRRSPLISIKLMLAGLFRESSTAPDLIQGALGRTWASKWHKNGITELRSRSPIAPSPAPG